MEAPPDDAADKLRASIMTCQDAPQANETPSNSGASNNPALASYGAVVVMEQNIIWFTASI